MENLFDPNREGGTSKPASAAMDRIDLDRLIKVVIKIHAAGVPHGELHVNNFMIDRHGNIVLLDFGKAIFDRAKKTHRDAVKILSHIDAIAREYNKKPNETQELNLIRSFANTKGDKSDYRQYMAAVSKLTLSNQADA
ncbi:MAG: hypothetical protein QNJ46_34335 [Leptolyngbyaceae cyanobacterium MO_188.B28]|nr:hypothetical protein [Leptolyngbyaceae cyanobacterium MO_188.B28]